MFKKTDKLEELKKMEINRIYLKETGLAMFLGGESQVSVFRAIAKRPGGTILRAVARELHRDGNSTIAYTTIATLANKLCDKGILRREKINMHAYRYHALFTEQEIIRQGITYVFRLFADQFPNDLEYTTKTLLHDTMKAMLKGV